MGFGAWLLHTVAVSFAGLSLCALGFAAWMLFQVISAGVGALHTSETSSSTMLKRGGGTQPSVRADDPSSAENEE